MGSKPSKEKQKTSKPKQNETKKTKNPPKADKDESQSRSLTTSTPAQTQSTSKPKKGQESSEGVSRKKILEMFDKYAAGADVMGPEEVMQFCSDLAVDPEDISVLILCWHFKAELSCYFKKDEFVNGCTELKTDSIYKLKEKMDGFRSELKDPNTFKDIYEFTFSWSRESTDKKLLDIETTVGMLELLLASEDYPFVAPFCEFLSEQTLYKAVNKDQWSSFLEFCKTIDQDLANYDENGSWPVMLDEFVKWLREKNPDNYSMPTEMNENFNS